MAGSVPSWGFLLRNGTRIVHGAGANIRPAFSPELNLPGTLHLFSAGQATGEPSTPCFRGAMGYFPFDTSMRMPRHVHISTGTGPRKYLVEKVFTLTGIGLVELAHEVYVVPPLTMVMIGPGVPHTWVAAPPGLDLKALGVATVEGEAKGEVEVQVQAPVSDGKFSAMFEYEDATDFYPTNQPGPLENVEDFERWEGSLQDIRFPKMGIEDVKNEAWFIWGNAIKKLDGTSPL